MNSFKIHTDDTLRETIPYGSESYPFAYYPEDIWQFDFHCIDWHWHHELEFMTVETGCAVCLAGTEKCKLEKGCGLFINSGVLHRFEADSSVFIPNIVFSPDLPAPPKSLIYEKYIEPVLKSGVPFLIFSPQSGWQNEILQLLRQIFSIQETEKNELRTIRLVLQMWEILYSHFDFTAAQNKTSHFSHQQARLQMMMQYIHDRYMEELALEDIAAAASISKSSALQIFQSLIHTSPVAYLIRYRLGRAAKQLAATEKTVSAIAAETGFANAGYFCRKFRQHYHMSPKEYRRLKR